MLGVVRLAGVLFLAAGSGGHHIGLDDWHSPHQRPVRYLAYTGAVLLNLSALFLLGPW